MGPERARKEASIPQLPCQQSGISGMVVDAEASLKRVVKVDKI